MRCLVIYGEQGQIFHMIQDDQIDGVIKTKILEIPEGKGIRMIDNEPFADDGSFDDEFMNMPEIEDGEFEEVEEEEESVEEAENGDN